MGTARCGAGRLVVKHANRRMYLVAVVDCVIVRCWKVYLCYRRLNHKKNDFGDFRSGGGDLPGFRSSALVLRGFTRLRRKIQVFLLRLKERTNGACLHEIVRKCQRLSTRERQPQNLKGINTGGRHTVSPPRGESRGFPAYMEAFPTRGYFQRVQYILGGRVN